MKFKGPEIQRIRKAEYVELPYKIAMKKRNNRKLKKSPQMFYTLLRNFVRYTKTPFYAYLRKLSWRLRFNI